jgi:hypothetical protein
MNTKQEESGVAWLAVAAGLWRGARLARQKVEGWTRFALALSGSFGFLMALLPGITFASAWPMTVGVGLYVWLDRGWEDALWQMVAMGAVGSALALLASWMSVRRGNALERQGEIGSVGHFDRATMGWASLRRQASQMGDEALDVAGSACGPIPGMAGWRLLARAARLGACSMSMAIMLVAPIGPWAALLVIRGVTREVVKAAKGVGALAAKAWSSPSQARWGEKLRQWERAGVGSEELAAAERLALRLSAKKGFKKSKATVEKRRL